MADAATPAPGIQAKFLTGNLMRHVTVMALTSSVGLIAVFAVDLINMIYISMLGRAELAAAIGYAGAILFFTGSFGIGMAIAVAALVSRAVGARDGARARQAATNGLIFGLAFGAAFAAVVWVFVPQLVALLGATGATADLAVHYLRIITPSQPLLMVGMIGGAILRSHGDAKRAMWATLAGAGVTVVLDPVLIFALDLDLTGAAIASVVSRVVIAAVALQPILRYHGGFDRPTLPGLSADLAPVFAVGIPAILTQIATPVGQAFVTRAISAYGEAAVAGFAIAGRLTPVAFGIIFALSGAIGPIIGQNAGAGLMDRVKRAFIDGLLFTLIVTLVVSAFLFLFRAPIADLFSATGLTRDLVYLFCGPLSLLWFFNGAIFVSNAACNNLGHPFQSTAINWGRQTIGTIPLMLWLGGVYAAPGVLVGQAMGGVVFGIAAVWLAWRVIGSATPDRVPTRPPVVTPAVAAPLSPSVDAGLDR